MRRTWIGTVAAAALATAAATGYAAAQEKQPGQQGAATQQTEKGQTQSGEAQGQMEKGERATMGQERTGQQRAEKPGMENKAAQGQRPGEEGMNKAQNERPPTNAEGHETGKANQGERMQGAQPAQTEKGAAAERKEQATGTQTEKGAATAERKEQATGTQTEKGAATEQRKEQATGTQTQTGGAAEQTKQGGTPNAPSGSEQRMTHVNPQQLHVTGSAQITNDKAAQISDTLLATATPQKINVAVNVGAPLPGEVNLLPLPADIVGIVPEFRDYDYVLVNDEIVIVQPSTRKVVEIINTGGATAMNAGGTQAMAGSRLNPCGP
jgi:Protein of unknown function (DUF1236)